MQSFLETITNIAKDIKKDVFDGYNEQTDEEIYKLGEKLVERDCKQNPSIKAYISQDKKEITTINEDGEYILSYVEIDNISVLDANFALGSIFAIYKDSIDAANIVFSAYVTYGPTFQMVAAFKNDNDVKHFSFEDGEFVEEETFVLNEKGKINSTGGDVKTFSDTHRALTQDLFEEGYRLRFSNSLSLDTHQILFKKGGLYSSPITAKDPQGTLDLVFEAYPIAKIIEKAGGAATDGKNRILDISCEDNLAKKTAFYFGSNYEMDKVTKAYA